MDDLRWLAAAGSLLVIAGCAVGWFERTIAAQVDGPVRVVRPDGLLWIGPGAWAVLALLVLAPLVLAPFADTSRRRVAVALAAALPGALLVAAAAAVRPRTAISGETVGEVVAPRTLGQALSLVGALIVVMALGEAWRRAPDWSQPAEWVRRTVTER